MCILRGNKCLYFRIDLLLETYSVSMLRYILIQQLGKGIYQYRSSILSHLLLIFAKYISHNTRGSDKPLPFFVNTDRGKPVRAI